MAGAAAARKPISVETRVVIATRARAELYRRSLYEFVKAAWSILEGTTAFEDNWHLKALCDHVQWMFEGWLIASGKGDAHMLRRVKMQWEYHGLRFIPGEVLVQNMIWNLSPGTLKSRILMVFAPAWMWLHDPSWSVCAISSVEDNVKRDSNAHRDLIVSPWYKQTFEIDWRIRRDIDAVGQWQTTAGGSRKSRSLQSGFVGVHVDCLLLDDPDDPDRVWNESDRRKVQSKWSRVIRRRVKNANIDLRIAIQQRVHVEDWTAAQVAKAIWSPDDRKGWAWIAVPVMFGHAPKECPRFTPFGWCDPRTIANDNMHPKRFTPEVLADEERDLGDGFQAQYNQNPERMDGGMIRRSYIRYFRLEGQAENTRPRPRGTGMTEEETPQVIPTHVLPMRNGRYDLDWLEISVDCSNGSERLTASQVGILVVGGKDEQRFVFDDRTAIMSIDGMYEAIRATIRAWPVGAVIIELKAAGPSVIADLRKYLERGDLVGPEGMPVIVDLVAYIDEHNDGKEARAAAMLSAWKAGLVFVLEGADWLYPKGGDNGKTLDQGFIGELCSFPKSKKNDRVDAMSQIMTHHRKSIDHMARWLAMARG